MNRRRKRLLSIRLVLVIHFIWTSSLSYSQDTERLNFSFSETPKQGFLTVRNQWPISAEGLTYGLNGQFDLKQDYLTSDESFSFSLRLAEGNYIVKVLVGGKSEKAITTIKAESRRLMVLNHVTPLGTVDTLTFVVNIRSARINENDSIRLKSREFDYLNWDQYLTLEFGGERPCIQSVMIEKREDLPTIFLAGNSTVVDQEREPWASWGQMFPYFLKPEIAVANFAESGESLRSFIAAGRLSKIESMIKPGDYLMVEFAHNDQKPGWTHVEAYTTYLEELMKFINLARAKGATPVLVTSTNRRKFDEEGNIINTLEDYPNAMRQLARKEKVHLVDLNDMSKTFYETLGVEASKRAFVHYAANTFPWQQQALADNTHFSTYGAFELAKCVIKGIKDSKDKIADLINQNYQGFDPAHPDPYEVWNWPISSKGSVTKPDGN